MICCSSEGEIRGFKFAVDDAKRMVANMCEDYQEAIRDLGQKKQVKKKWWRINTFEFQIIDITSWTSKSSRCNNDK